MTSKEKCSNDQIIKEIDKERYGTGWTCLSFDSGTGLSEPDHAGLYVRHDSACSDRGKCHGRYTCSGRQDAALCGGLTFDGSLYCCLRGKDFSKFFCQPARTGI